MSPIPFDYFEVRMQALQWGWAQCLLCLRRKRKSKFTLYWGYDSLISRFFFVDKVMMDGHKALQCPTCVGMQTTGCGYCQGKGTSTKEKKWKGIVIELD